MVSRNRTLAATHTHTPTSYIHRFYQQASSLRMKTRINSFNSKMLINAYYPLLWIGQTWDIRETFDGEKPRKQVSSSMNQS